MADVRNDDSLNKGREGVDYDYRSMDRSAWEEGRRIYDKNQAQISAAMQPDFGSAGGDVIYPMAMGGLVQGIRSVARYLFSLWRWWLGAGLAAAALVLALAGLGVDVTDESTPSVWDAVGVWAITAAVVGILIGTAFRMVRGVYRTIVKRRV